MFVYVFHGLTVGWWKEERHSSDTTARSAGFKSQAGCAVFRVVLSRKEKGEERGKYPEAPPHIKGKKERKKQADQYGEKGKAIKK
jgi:hypothetical protein